MVFPLWLDLVVTLCTYDNAIDNAWPKNSLHPTISQVPPVFPTNITHIPLTFRTEYDKTSNRNNDHLSPGDISNNRIADIYQWMIFLTSLIWTLPLVMTHYYLTLLLPDLALHRNRFFLFSTTRVIAVSEGNQ